MALEGHKTGQNPLNHRVGGEVQDKGQNRLV